MVARSKKIYTISADDPFVDNLAEGIMTRHGAADDPLALARVQILVPTRRAVRSLSDAFIRLAGRDSSRALLLPKISPIGDVDEDALIMEDGSDNIVGERELYFEAPEAIPVLRRNFILSRLILKWGQIEREQGRSIGAGEPAQALRLAAELGRFLDSLDTHGIDPSALQTLVPDAYTEYWQETLQFLAVITQEWPEILKASGMIDQMSRRNLLLRELASQWRASPPAHPVIAAGSTGSVPATAQLLSVIAQAPQGCVVLPGLDLDLDDAAWTAIDDTHPQAGMKELLERLNANRKDVRPWPQSKTARARSETHNARRRLINEALRPAGATEGWRAAVQNFKSLRLDKGLEGLSCIHAAHPGEEALAIALILRGAAERPGKTAALVTPDRGLSRRVAALMRRWEIEIDDSAGQPLGQTPVGNFLRLLADMIRDDGAPVTLLSLLKHPLAQCGMERGAHCRAVETLEIFALRGLRPSGGFEGLRQILISQQEKITASKGAANMASVLQILDVLDRALGPLLNAGPSDALSLKHLAAAHIQAAEEISSGPDDTRALWSGDAGETASAFMQDLWQASDDAPPMRAQAYPNLFDMLVMERAVRPPYGAHPRLFIWGPLEARLQRADTIILGGLNEGTWPVQAQSDPWLNRPMRAGLGLPMPERRIGLAAHDFAQLTSAPSVIMTRSQKVDGAPTVPSRWLLRLETILKGAGHLERLEEPAPYLAWARAMDQPDRIAPLNPPEPRPPVSARPRRYSVTEIETWTRDPYALYAKKILALKPLDPLDDNPGRADRGLIIHAILDKFVRSYPHTLPENAVNALIDIGQQEFARVINTPGVRAIWQPRFERIAHWFIDFERAYRERAAPVATEVKGEIIIPGRQGDVTLVARADRIDQQADGLAIIDYKTGSAPSGTQVKTQISPQLPLEGLIAREGGFSGVKATPVAAFSYIELKGGVVPGKIIPIAHGAEAETIIEDAYKGLMTLIAAFDKSETPYRSVVRPMLLSRYRPYDHLARVKEWLTQGNEPEGGGA